MSTECIASKLQFQGLGRRRVEAEFNGGTDHLRRRRVAVTGGGEPLWVH